MVKIIEAGEFLSLSNSIPIADVRSPAEYTKGHFPGAMQLPLFSNEERAEVGKLYAHQGKDKAMQSGMALAGARLTEYVEEALTISPEKKILLYCWRGGMRSNSLGWLLDSAGFETYVLQGGYKAYRRFVHSSFARKARIIVIGGYTGSGKTELLESMRRLGEQTINLELTANHKGSAFGFIGMPNQPSQEQFENLLHKQWTMLDLSRNIWLEDESINIGTNQIPRVLFDQMLHAPMILTDVSRDLRIRRLVSEYSCFDNEVLAGCFKKIEQRLGGEHVQEALKAIAEGNYEFAADLALHYYDKAYKHQITKRNPRFVTKLTMSGSDVQNDSKLLISLAHETYSETIQENL